MKRSSSVVIALLASLLPQVGRSAEVIPANGVAARGISGVTPEPVMRREAPDAPPGRTWLYQVALPFQVSRTQAAIFCNLREALAQGVDFEVGNDVIVFGSVAEIATAKPVALNRNTTEPNPKSTVPGQPATMVKYPMRGGFVPLGAKLVDGTPHPAAGTGFGLSMAQAWKILSEGPPPYKQGSYAGAESYSYWEFQQYAFDGSHFTVAGSSRVEPDKLLPGWIFPNGGLRNAIPDGEDLLVAMVGKTVKTGAGGVRASGCGVLRMRREGGEWRPVNFQLVPGTQGFIEPSLVRDADGSLLFCGRGGGEPDHHHDILIWRSKDDGESWTKILEAKGVVSAAPITLNQAADGTPFITANPQAVMPGPRDPITLTSKGRPVEAGMNTRSSLCLWPLNEARTALGQPLVVRDCRGDFGPPDGGSRWTWRADHPSATAVRLADGKWHTLLGVRVQDYREIKEAMPPTPRTGLYVHEVLSAGLAQPGWRF